MDWITYLSWFWKCCSKKFEFYPEDIGEQMKDLKKVVEGGQDQNYNTENPLAVWIQ